MITSFNFCEQNMSTKPAECSAEPDALAYVYGGGQCHALSTTGSNKDSDIQDPGNETAKVTGIALTFSEKEKKCSAATPAKDYSVRVQLMCEKDAPTTFVDRNNDPCAIVLTYKSE